jgi:hypothetical protein
VIEGEPEQVKALPAVHVATPMVNVFVSVLSQLKSVYPLKLPPSQGCGKDSGSIFSISAACGTRCWFGGNVEGMMAVL